MFEFHKLCNELEKLTPVQRGALLAEKSVTVLKGLKSLDLDVDPVPTLVTFIIGSAVSDGVLSEKDYLSIYPSLVKTFGDDFDFASAKRVLQIAKDVKKEIENLTQTLITVIAACDEKLASDVISLCLLVTSVDGKISLKEKRYIRRLCKA